MRLVELFVMINAICGIAAFLIARGLWKKASRKFRSLYEGDEPRPVCPKHGVDYRVGCPTCPNPLSLAHEQRRLGS